MATAASSSSSPCISFIEESLILPTRNARLFAFTSLLIFAHTFLFLAVAVLHVHPLAATVLSDIDALKSFDPASYIYGMALGRTQKQAKVLLLVYLAYVASKLTTQVVTVLAASATCSGERSSFAEMLRWKVVKARIRGLFVTAAFVGVLELTSTTLLVVLLTFSLSYTDSVASSLGLYLPLLLALPFYLYLGAVFPVSLAVSAAEEDCRGVRALRRAWRLMKARRKEAAVLALVASLLPVAIYPGYTFLLDLTLMEAVCMMSIQYGFLLPSVGVQLYSMVAATVFYYQCMEAERMETVASGPARVSSDEAVVQV